MVERSGKAREICLLGDFGDVALTANGARVEVHTDGSVLAYTDGDVRKLPAINDGGKPKASAAPKDYAIIMLDAQAHHDWVLPTKAELDMFFGPAVNDDDQRNATAAPQIGDPDDGGVYVGKSATTGKPLHAAIRDEPQCLTFIEAGAAAEKMRKQPGRENAHVPTPAELDKNLFANRFTGKLAGTFNASGSFPANCYRSCAPYANNFSRVQYFDDGEPNYCNRYYRLPVRLVW